MLQTILPFGNLTDLNLYSLSLGDRNRRATIWQNLWLVCWLAECFGMDFCGGQQHCHDEQYDRLRLFALPRRIHSSALAYLYLLSDHVVDLLLHSDVRTASTGGY